GTTGHHSLLKGTTTFHRTGRSKKQAAHTQNSSQRTKPLGPRGGQPPTALSSRRITLSFQTFLGVVSSVHNCYSVVGREGFLTAPKKTSTKRGTTTHHTRKTPCRRYRLPTDLAFQHVIFVRLRPQCLGALLAARLLSSVPESKRKPPCRPTRRCLETIHGAVTGHVISTYCNTDGYTALARCTM
ncbi:unnamed protein product, partial [Ectocarpus sp. 12 AP-2014]